MSENEKSGEIGSPNHPEEKYRESEKQLKAFTESNLLMEEKNDKNTRCGMFGWEPKCLQKCTTPTVLLICLCCFMFVQGFVEKGIVYVNLVTWEKLYGMHSRQASWIVSSFSISAAILNIIYGYIGKYIHNGRIIAVSAFVQGIGSFVMLIVHFISKPYRIGAMAVEICTPIETRQYTTDVCKEETNHIFLWMFIFGQVLHAVGGAATFTTAVPYLDTQIHPRDTPLYIGILQSFAALGPAFGYILGGLFLNIYVDYGRDIESIDITSTDPRWVGAWWIGLAISGVSAIFVSILMAGFPRELPSAKEYRDIRDLESYHQTSESENHETKGFKGLVLSLRAIWTNPIWVCIMLLQITESGFVIGFAAFMPKIIQHLFKKSHVTSSIVTGIVIVPGIVVGKVIGGLIPKLFDFKIKGLLTQSLFATVAGLLFSLSFLLKCDNAKIAGVTVPYLNSQSQNTFDLNNDCNTNCGCTSEGYDPICGENEIQYFSPCYAGCQEYLDTNNTYSSCTCIQQSLGNSKINNDSSSNGVASAGSCKQHCHTFYPFLFLLLAKCIVTYIADAAAQGATLRSLSEDHKSLALGIQASIHCILGHAPKLYLIGYIFDRACLQWQQSCAEDGACWIYDTSGVAYGLLIVALCIKTFSIVCFGLALCVNKKTQKKSTQGDISQYKSLQ